MLKAKIEGNFYIENCIRNCYVFSLTAVHFTINIDLEEWI